MLKYLIMLFNLLTFPKLLYTLFTNKLTETRVIVYKISQNCVINKIFY